MARHVMFTMLPCPMIIRWFGRVPVHGCHNVPVVTVERPEMLTTPAQYTSQVTGRDRHDNAHPSLDDYIESACRKDAETSLINAFSLGRMGLLSWVRLNLENPSSRLTFPSFCADQTSRRRLSEDCEIPQVSLAMQCRQTATSRIMLRQGWNQD
jgi:hypothetical protein